jgi:hypothetical protein
MHGYADAFAKAPRQLAQTGADVLVEELERALIRATRGDRRLSNLDSRAPVPRVAIVHDDTAEITASGSVWSILENGTAGHVIRPRRGRVLRIGDEWRSGPARVRGVRGRRTYSATVERATDTVMTAQREQWERIHRGG